MPCHVAFVPLKKCEREGQIALLIKCRNSVAKRRQRLWQTICLLINTTNAGNKEIVKWHTVWSYFLVLTSSRVISGIMYRTLPVKTVTGFIQGKTRNCSPCRVLFPNNDRRSINYPLHICTPKTHIYTTRRHQVQICVFGVQINSIIARGMLISHKNTLYWGLVVMVCPLVARTTPPSYCWRWWRVVMTARTQRESCLTCGLVSWLEH